MQQKLKKRIDTHLGEVCELANKNKSSYSFVRHFASLFPPEAKIARNDVRKLICVEII